MADTINYNRTITDKLSIKGILSDDRKTITCEKDKMEIEISIEECLAPFRGKPIDFSLQEKMTEPLPIGE